MAACETKEQTKNSITLKGSAKIIVEYLEFGINNILFIRGIYPPESFKPVQQYGLSILMSQDEKIQEFIKAVMGQTRDWLAQDKVNKITMIIKNVAADETLEKWDFVVESENADKENVDDMNRVATKDLKVIQKEIRDVMLQISATVSYLPLLDCICSFDVLIHTKADCDVPKEWSETKAVVIQNEQEVPFRSFSTGLHKLSTVVHYKLDL